jgi:hypothetical protein
MDPIPARIRPRARARAGDRRPAPAAAIAVAVAVTIVLGGCLPAGTRGSALASAGGSGSPASAPVDVRPSGPTPIPSFVPPTPTPAPTFMVVTVKQGDSLNTIAHQFGTTARSIAFWNRSTYPSLDPESPSYKPGLLQPGWTLYLIPGLVYDEDSGEAVDPSGAIPAP